MSNVKLHIDFFFYLASKNKSWKEDQKKKKKKKKNKQSGQIQALKKNIGNVRIE